MRRARRPNKHWVRRRESDRPRLDRSCRHADCAAVRRTRRLRAWRHRAVIYGDIRWPRFTARRSGNLLHRFAGFHARFDPDVCDDGRGNRLLTGWQGPLRGARSLALSHSGRLGDLQSRRLRNFRGAHWLVARLLRGDRQDGHSGNASARLSGRRRHWLDLRRRHAWHSDPAIDYVHSLRHCHRNFDRPAVPRRRCPGPDAHWTVHTVDDLHHLEARLSLARRRFPVFVERKVPVDPEDRALYRDYRGRDVRTVWWRGDAIGSGRCRRGALRVDGDPHLSHVVAGEVVADSARHDARIRDDLDDYRRRGAVRLHAYVALSHADAGAGDRRYARQQMGVDADDQHLSPGVWLLHSACGDHPDDLAHSPADHNHRRLRSGLVRRCVDYQYGDRAYPPPGGAEHLHCQFDCP